MEKRSLVFLFLELVAIFLWLFFVGQTTGVSGISGDINMVDEGQYAAWINHMLHGKIIYKDFFVQYGPLQVYPVYLLIKLFGTSMFFVRFAIGTLGVFLGICVALLVLRYLNVHPLVRGITIAFLVLIPGIHIRHWIGILCFLLIVKAYRLQSAKLALITGILLAFTVLGSIDVGIFSILIIVVYLLIHSIRTNTVKRTLHLLCLIFFGFIFSLFILLLFAMKEGWFISYIKTTIEFLIFVSGVNLPNGQGLPDIFTIQLNLSPIEILRFIFSKSMLFYWSLLILLMFLAILVIRYILRITTKKDEMVFLIICFGILTYASIIGRSGHYFLVTPMVLICGSYFLSLLFSQNHIKAIKFFSIIFFIIFILYGIRHILIFRYTPFFNPVPKEQLNVSVPKVAPFGISASQARDILILQSFFNKNTKRTDTIFVINNIPALYFLLDRENATLYDLPLLAYSREKRLEIVSSLRQHSPLYIIEDEKAWDVDGISDRQRLPEVIEYIEKHYVKYKSIEHFLLYKRIDSLSS